MLVRNFADRTRANENQESEYRDLRQDGDGVDGTTGDKSIFFCNLLEKSISVLQKLRKNAIETESIDVRRFNTRT